MNEMIVTIIVLLMLLSPYVLYALKHKHKHYLPSQYQVVLEPIP